MRKWVWGAWVWLLLCSAWECPAYIDALHIGLLNGRTLPLRWENIEDGALVIEGPQPVCAQPYGLHTVRLKASRSVKVRIPAGETLRIETFGKERVLDRLVISVSNGSGLHALIPFAVDEHRHAAWIDPESDEPLVCRITLDSKSPTDAVLALFLSVHNPSGPIAPYRELLPLTGETVSFAQENHPGEKHFRRLMPGRSYPVRVQGPKRIAVENRLIYPEEESATGIRYYLQCLLDDKPFAALDFETGPETSSVVRVNHVPVVCGVPEKDFLDIPAGDHVLTLVPYAEVLLRLLALTPPDYLVPALNAPKELSRNIKVLESRFSECGILTGAELLKVAEPFENPAAVEKIARYVARQNRFPQGGLLGAALLDQQARRRPDAPEIRTAADRLLVDHTVYREVLPDIKPMAAPQQTLPFVLPRLKRRTDIHLVAAEQHIRTACGHGIYPYVHTAHFNALPVWALAAEDRSVPAVSTDTGDTAAPGPLHYSLPGRIAPSWLRILVKPGRRPHFFSVRFDTGVIRRFCVLPRKELSEDQYRLTTAEAAIHLRRQTCGRARHPRYSDADVSFNPFLFADQWIEPAFWEVALPPEVRGLDVWQDAPSECAIALQYQTAVPCQMSETEYLQTEDLIESDKKRFDRFVQLLMSGEMDAGDVEDGVDAGRTAMHALQNFWLPCVRLIRSRRAVFIAAQAPGDGRMAFHDALPEEKIEALTRQARAMENRRQPLAALEKWAQVFYGTSETLNAPSAFHMADALMALQEPCLGEALLRYVMLQAVDQDTAQEAFERLDAVYRRSDTPEKLLPLYAARAVRYPSPQAIRELAERLFSQGHHQEALIAALALPADVRPSDLVLRTSRAMGWYRIYDRQVDHLPQGQRKILWQALKALDRGDGDTARRLLEKAGAEGEHRLNLLDRGCRIQQILYSRDIGERRQGIVAWEDWQAELPLDPIRREAIDDVRDYDGGVMLYHQPQDLFSVAFRATPNRPVTAELYGPGKAVVTVRALHAAPEHQAAGIPLDTWFGLDQNGREILIPITGSLPESGLEIVGNGDAVPGARVTVPLDLKSGINTLAVRGYDVPVIVQIHALRPYIPADVLPALTLGNVEWILNGPVNDIVEEMPDECFPCRFHDCFKLLFDDGDVGAVPKAPIRTRCNAAFVKTVTDWTRLAALRTPRPEGGPCMKAAVESEPAAAVFGKMYHLVRQAELYPENILSYEVEARRLCERNMHLSGLKPLLDRITSRTAWRPYELVEADAGLRAIAADGLQPETDGLRIGKALAAPFESRGRMIDRSGDLVLSMNNAAPLRLRLDLSMEDIPLLRPAGMVAFYRIDHEALHQVPLSREASCRQIEIEVPRGIHRLTVGLSQSYAEQFLNVRYRRMAGPDRWVDLELGPSNERKYYVATHDRPVKVRVSGPAWLRVDQLLGNGDVLVHDRYVAPGPRQLLLQPENDAPEALFRIFKREKRYDPLKVVMARPAEVPCDVVSSPPFTVTPLPRPERVRFEDPYPLGGYEDGSWSTAVKYRKRQNFEEDRNDAGGSHIYELSAVHDYYLQSLPAYFKTGFLGRFRRDAGGPTVGLWEDFLYYPRRIPLAINLQGRLYLQQPESERFEFSDAGTTEYSLLFKADFSQERMLGPKCRHTPTFSVFERLLSINNDNAYDPKVLDRDVFTPYKQDHRYGVSVSDSLTWRPWLDTWWYAKGAVNSNEDFNLLEPDNIKIEIGWEQLLQPLRIHMDYRYAYYFSDNDRGVDSHRNILGLNVLWNHWLKDWRRFELAVDFQQDLDEDECSAWVSFTWFFSKGQGLRNIRPRDLDFHDLEQSRLPREMNQNIHPVMYPVADTER